MATNNAVNNVPSNVRTTLSGGVWDFSTGNLVEITLNSDTTISVVNTKDLDVGMLIVHQDSTGGYTLSIVDGNMPVDFEILPGAGAATTLTFFNNNGVLYWYMGGQHAASPAPPVDGTITDLSFNSLVGLTHTADTYIAGGGGGWSHYGVNSPVSFAAGQNFLVFQEVRTSSATNAAIALDESAAGGSFGVDVAYALYDANYPSGNFVLFQNSSAYTSANAAIPTSGVFYLGLQRILGNTIQVVYSLDKSTWTLLYTHPTTNSGILYPMIYIYQTATLYAPQYKLLP